MKKFKNELFSSLIHLFGLAFILFALIYLSFYTNIFSNIMYKVGFIVFTLSLVFLYLASSIYHLFPKQTSIKKIWQRIDHAMVFVLMAGTYTPICLAMDNRICGWSLLTISWIIAIVGVIIKAKGIKISDWLSTSIYVFFGMLIVTAFHPISQWLSKDGLGWLFGGGSLYLFGVIFFVLDDFIETKFDFGFHEIWHLFVLGGSLSHVWLMMKYVFV